MSFPQSGIRSVESVNTQRCNLDVEDGEKEVDKQRHKVAMEDAMIYWSGR